jgi:hypothetical protein
MTSIAFLRHSTECPGCGEESVAPERSEYISIGEIHHFWCCWNCGNEFETLDHVDAAASLPSELIIKGLPVRSPHNPENGNGSSSH